MVDLMFDRDGVSKLMAHSRRRPWELTYVQQQDKSLTENNVGAHLWLVKDEGIYLMSNAKAPWLDPEAEPGSEKRFVVYADGYDPQKDGDVWQACREAAGGDDFVEALPLIYFEYVVRQGDVCIRLTESTIDVLLLEVPRRKKRGN